MAQKQTLIVNLGYQQVHLDVEEKLGEGAFGTVTRAVDNRGVSFAVKHVVCYDRDTYLSVHQEVSILFQLKHPNIVAVYGFEYQVHFSTAVLIMEYCSKGTLNSRLDRPVEFMVQLKWMDQLAGALAYLHGSNIVHRDLKTENVLLSDNDDVKIADFGISRPFLCCKTGRLGINPNNFINEYLDAHMGTFAGTPFWIAPEVFDNHYTEKADIFSLGVIFYAICERQFILFQNERYYGAFTNYRGIDTGIGLVMFEQHQHIKPLFKVTKGATLKTLILSMLHFYPNERKSLTDVQDDINGAYMDSLVIEDPVGNLEVLPTIDNNVKEVRKARRGKSSKLPEGGQEKLSIPVEKPIEKNESIDKEDKPKRKTRSSSRKNEGHHVNEKPNRPALKEPVEKKESLSKEGKPKRTTKSAVPKNASQPVNGEPRQPGKMHHKISLEKTEDGKNMQKRNTSAQPVLDKKEGKKQSSANRTNKNGKKKETSGTDKDLVVGKRKKKTVKTTYL